MSPDDDSAPLYGLLLAGGQSRRMGQDKALLAYHGKPQLIWAYELLHKVCEKTFVSVASNQTQEPTRAALPQLVDSGDSGPSGGLLVAYGEYPNAAWLAMACDLPFVEHETLRYLVDSRAPHLDATAFISSSDTLPEPLCAIWEPAGLSKLHDQVANSVLCPRKCLINADVRLLDQANPVWLDNVNSQTDLTSKNLMV